MGVQDEQLSTQMLEDQLTLSWLIVPPALLFVHPDLGSFLLPVVYSLANIQNKY